MSSFIGVEGSTHDVRRLPAIVFMYFQIHTYVHFISKLKGLFLGFPILPQIVR